MVSLAQGAAYSWATSYDSDLLEYATTLIATVGAGGLLEGRYRSYDPEYAYAEAQRLGGFNRLRQGNPIGVIFLSRRQTALHRQASWRTTFADQAVIAIENVRLFAGRAAAHAPIIRSHRALYTLTISSAPGRVGAGVSGLAANRRGCVRPGGWSKEMPSEPRRCGRLPGAVAGRNRPPRHRRARKMRQPAADLRASRATG